MSVIIWLIALSLFVWFALVIGFVVYTSAVALQNRAEDVHWFFAVPMIVVEAMGFLADIAWNYTAGMVIYREWSAPERTFSERSHRHKVGPAGWRQVRAQWWCDQANKFQKDHC